LQPTRGIADELTGKPDAASVASLLAYHFLQQNLPL